MSTRISPLPGCGATCWPTASGFELRAPGCVRTAARMDQTIRQAMKANRIGVRVRGAPIVVVVRVSGEWAESGERGVAGPQAAGSRIADMLPIESAIAGSGPNA